MNTNIGCESKPMHQSNLGIPVSSKVVGYQARVGTLDQ